MPIFKYFLIAGAVLVGLFYIADATLEKGVSPVGTSGVSVYLSRGIPIRYKLLSGHQRLSRT